MCDIKSNQMASCCCHSLTLVLDTHYFCSSNIGYFFLLTYFFVFGKFENPNCSRLVKITKIVYMTKVEYLITDFTAFVYYTWFHLISICISEMQTQFLEEIPWLPDVWMR